MKSWVGTKIPNATEPNRLWGGLGGSFSPSVSDLRWPHAATLCLSVFNVKGIRVAHRIRISAVQPGFWLSETQSLSENSVESCGEGFWLQPRRRGRSIPATGCDGRANADTGKRPAARRVFAE